MDTQPDFQKEMSSIEWLCHQLGVEASHSPKFHCEIAGEGIEYAWCGGKSEYRRRPMSAKKGMENFRKLVKECFGSTVLTHLRAKKCARRVRAYICTYFALDSVALNADANLDNYQKLPYALIQKTQENIRSHHSIFHFDAAHAVEILQETAK
jgi:hypothetical protein